MTEYRIPFIRPSFPSSAEIGNDLDRIVDSNWFTNFGPLEVEFSRALEGYLGQDLHVTTMANGTLALLAAISCAIGRGQPDRYLLMPSFTFVAVPQAAIWNGYAPWFIDIDPHTWQASQDSAVAVLDSNRDKIAGIVLPNALGVGSPHIDDWEKLANQWGLPLVIDSAAGFGSLYGDGEPLGARGSCEIFSFHATKPFAIGEGGAIASRNLALIERARAFQNFGFSSSRVCTQLGINAKLSELGAATGLRQLVALNGRIASRRRTFERYREALSPLGLGFQPNAENSSLQCCSISCATHEQKVSVQSSLESHRVQARDYYNPPLHLHPLFAEIANPGIPSQLADTENLCSRVISLPICDDMRAEEVELVIEAVRQGLA